jgi:hypothetical protein
MTIVCHACTINIMDDATINDASRTVIDTYDCK